MPRKFKDIIKLIEKDGWWLRLEVTGSTSILPNLVA